MRLPTAIITRWPARMPWAPRPVARRATSSSSRAQVRRAPAALDQGLPLGARRRQPRPQLGDVVGAACGDPSTARRRPGACAATLRPLTPSARPRRLNLQQRSALAGEAAAASAEVENALVRRRRTPPRPPSSTSTTPSCRAPASSTSRAGCTAASSSPRRDIARRRLEAGLLPDRRRRGPRARRRGPQLRAGASSPGTPSPSSRSSARRSSTRRWPTGSGPAPAPWPRSTSTRASGCGW